MFERLVGEDRDKVIYVVIIKDIDGRVHVARQISLFNELHVG